MACLAKLGSGLGRFFPGGFPWDHMNEHRVSNATALDIAFFDRFEKAFVVDFDMRSIMIFPLLSCYTYLKSQNVARFYKAHYVTMALIAREA